MPAEVLNTPRISCRHHIAGVGRDVQERVLEDPDCMVAPSILSHRVVYVLVLLVLQLQRDDGQAVEEEDEIDLVVVTRPNHAEVEMRPERDAVLGVLGHCRAAGRTRRGIEQPELEPAHLQPMAQQHPQRRAIQLSAQRTEHFIPRIGAVVVLQLLQLLGLRGVEKGPKMVFSDEVLCVGDARLIQHGVAIHTDQEVRDVLLECQLRRLLSGHGLSLA